MSLDECRTLPLSPLMGLKNTKQWFCYRYHYSSLEPLAILWCGRCCRLWCIWCIWHAYEVCWGHVSM